MCRHRPIYQGYCFWDEWQARSGGCGSSRSFFFQRSQVQIWNHHEPSLLFDFSFKVIGVTILPSIESVKFLFFLWETIFVLFVSICYTIPLQAPHPTLWTTPRFYPVAETASAASGVASAPPVACKRHTSPSLDRSSWVHRWNFWGNPRDQKETVNET